jgi:hypothetical protein
MKKILKYRKLATILKYRATENGWMAKDFYSRANNLGAATILLLRLKDGPCIGGFT